MKFVVDRRQFAPGKVITLMPDGQQAAGYKHLAPHFTPSPGREDTSLGTNRAGSALPYWFSTINVQFGKRVAALRLCRSLSPWELAGNIGISFAHLEDIEGGREEVDLMLLSRLAGEFRMSMADLVQGM